MTLVVRPATALEADECLTVLRAAQTTEFGPLGALSWARPGMPAVVRRDAEDGRLYGAWKDGVLVATFALCEEPDDYFADVAWCDPSAPARYLHRLAVLPSHHGSGIGAICLAEAERRSAAVGATYLRLDMLAENARVRRFYEGRSYQYRGTVWPESGEPAKPRVPLACFEKAVAPTVRIRPAAVADASILATISAEMFVETYARFNDPANLAAHVAARFNPAQQAAELHAPRATMLLGFIGDETRPAAYAYFGPGETPPEVTDPGAVEIKRFYVASSYHGLGVARTMMRAVIERAAATLWLGVWERNPRAIAFYEKVGFATVGRTTYDLGTDRQQDLVMVRPV
jgi:ribosomal protein S18 acetylase RimI-like enzyme